MNSIISTFSGYLGSWRSAQVQPASLELADAGKTRTVPSLIQTLSGYLGFWKRAPIQPLPQKLSDAKVEKLAGLMETVIAKKDENIQTVLKNRVSRKEDIASEAILIGGDLFTMGYLAFEGAQAAAPAIAAIPAIGIATLICGEIAGLINIGVAFVCLKESLQAFENGDKKLGIRLFIDFVTFTTIGLIMILASLATKVAALGAVGALFTTNPWLLPVLFFIVSIPIITEISARIKNIWTNQNLASHLSGDLSKLIHDPKKGVFYLDPLLNLPKKEALEKLSEKMETLQADMGARAALETFRLLLLLLKNQDTKAQLKKVEKEVAEWNRAQYVRMLQQILFAAAFAVSMIGLAPRVNGAALNAVENFSMTGANAIPLYMDIFWPFKRNTTLVVPKVAVS